MLESRAKATTRLDNIVSAGFKQEEGPKERVF